MHSTVSSLGACALLGIAWRGAAQPDGSPSRAPATFELGKVTVRKAERTVSFPAVVNMRTGVVEYAVVTTAGKTHESVFRTEAQPEHIHVALLLLNAKPASTEVFPPDLNIAPPGEAVGIEVGWSQDGSEVRRPLEDFIVTTNNQQPLSRGPWIYNGSYVSNGRFLAQDEGSIVSVHIDPAALCNSPRAGRDNDDLNHVNSATLPPAAQPLQIYIKLQPEPPPASQRTAGPREPPSSKGNQPLSVPPA